MSLGRLGATALGAPLSGPQFTFLFSLSSFFITLRLLSFILKNPLYYLLQYNMLVFMYMVRWVNFAFRFQGFFSFGIIFGLLGLGIEANTLSKLSTTELRVTHFMLTL